MPDDSIIVGLVTGVIEPICDFVFLSYRPWDKDRIMATDIECAVSLIKESKVRPQI